MWETQGKIALRDREALGTTDAGIVMFRRMLQRELGHVEAGRDPLGVVRDPTKNASIHLPLESGKELLSDGFESTLRPNTIVFSPFRDELFTLLQSAALANSVTPIR